MIYEGRSIPIHCHILDKLGSSNLAEQQAILNPILALLKSYKVVVLGDREFCSVKLGKWLKEQAVYFCLRLKRNEFIQHKGKIWVEGIQKYVGRIQETQT